MASESDTPKEPAEEQETQTPDAVWQAVSDELEAFATSDRIDLLLEAFAHNMPAKLDEDTFSNVREPGVLLVGEHGFRGLLWAADARDLASGIGSLNLSSEAEECVTRIIALYGPKLRTALHLSDVPASRKDDWDRFSSNVFWDEKKNEHVITTEIVKYNGEELRVTDDR